MNVLVGSEITLYGTVGADLFGDGFTPHDVARALAEIGPETRATVRINSGGGSAFDGLAIYNALKAHKGGVDVIVDGIAASAASVIAMAGDSIVMRQGSLFMIHEPATWSSGNAADLKRGAEFLDMLGDKMAGIYSARTGNGVSEMRDAMRAETWMDGAIAVAMGFATSTEDAEALTATAFDYRLYKNAPDTLKALASANAWAFQPGRAPTIEGQSMTDKTPGAVIKPEDVTAAGAAGAAAAKARIKAIMQHDEAKGREQQAEHLAYETDMSVDAAVAILKSGSKALPEMGACDTFAGLELQTQPAKKSPEAEAREGWAVAVAEVNKRMGR